jgi:tripartite ATP-independent transporter DctM subunit
LPLFTLTGFLLAEGKASERLLRLFRAWVGWIPGGTAVVTAALCAFFTVFTGGSGVTILALGGLLFPALVRDGYRERFSLGLITASGSLGLLWPPSFPIFIYAVVANIPYENLFIGGALPGFLMFALVAALGVREGMTSGAGRTAWNAKEARAALWVAKWEVLLPVVVLVVIFGGFATIVESAAISALYALIAQCFINRDLDPRRDLLRVIQRCCVVIGGVLIILGVAVGFTNYLIDAQVATRAVEWAQSTLHSQFSFLLALNVLLLIVGCLMDIFAAIAVVVPLLIPISQAFGVDPVHLGIIFIANLELGYLTPPVGLNLYLSSYRFGKSVMEVTRATLPMLLILLLGVLLITYVPALTMGPLHLLGRSTGGN